MDIKDIKKIVQLMKLNDLTEFELEDGGMRIAVKRGAEGVPAVVTHVPIQTEVAPTIAAPTAEPVAAAPAVEEDNGYVTINAPIVGTFYRSASPEADSLVSVGQVIEEDTVVCIVEAMKVMNEIKAEISGTIRKILVENATPVEYGQPLFYIDPA